MGLSNNIYELPLDRLIQTLPNLHQFSKKMDYCAISGLLMNAEASGSAMNKNLLNPQKLMVFKSYLQFLLAR